MEFITKKVNLISRLKFISLGASSWSCKEGLFSTRLFYLLKELCKRDRSIELGLDHHASVKPLSSIMVAKFSDDSKLVWLREHFCDENSPRFDRF